MPSLFQVGKLKVKNRPGRLMNYDDGQSDMMSNDSADQSPPVNTPNPDGVTSPGSGLKGKLFGSTTGGEVGAYGVKTPVEHKEGLLSKILSYALPALLTASTGTGLLPGLGMAFAGRKNLQREGEKENKELYGKQVEEARKGQEFGQSFGLDKDKFGLEQKKAGETNRHNVENERLGWGRLGTLKGDLSGQDEAALGHLSRFPQDRIDEIRKADDNTLIIAMGQATDPREKAMYKAMLKARKASKMGSQDPLMSGIGLGD